MAIPIPGIFIQGSTFFREALVLTLRATLCGLRLSVTRSSIKLRQSFTIGEYAYIIIMMCVLVASAAQSVGIGRLQDVGWTSK